MAKKSKTQKAKAAAARAKRKADKAKALEEQEALKETAGQSDEHGKKAKKLQNKKAKEEQKKTAAQIRQEKRDAKMAAKENKAPRKHNKFVQFFIDVKSEMKRVTWPSRKDVIQWSGVVVAALVFFGVYVAILDN